MVRTSTKTRENARKILGAGEPTFDCLSSDRIDLIRALNYYAIHNTYENSKEWAAEWASVNSPEHLSTVSKASIFDINNIGFVCRILDNGYLDEDLPKMIIDQFNRISKKISEKKSSIVEEKKQKVQQVKRIEPNAMLEQFDYACDAICSGSVPENINYTDNRKHLIELKDAASKIQLEVYEYPDQYKNQKDLKKYLKSVIDKVDAVIKTVKTNAIKARKPRKIDPIKMVSNIVLESVDNELGCKTLKATAIIGATKLVLWHPERRTLSVYISMNENGFLVSGRSLKNYDPDKSITKKIRKPSEMWNAIKDMTATRMHLWLRDVCKTAAAPAKALIPDGTIILKV